MSDNNYHGLREWVKTHRGNTPHTRDVVRLLDERDTLSREHATCSRILAIVREYAADPESVRRLGVTCVPWLDDILAERDDLRASRENLLRQQSAMQRGIWELRSACGPFLGWAVRMAVINGDGERDHCPVPNSEGVTMGDLRRLVEAVAATAPPS